MGEGKLNAARLTYESRLQMLTDIKELNRLADMTSMITQLQPVMGKSQLESNRSLTSLLFKI